MSNIMYHWRAPAVAKVLMNYIRVHEFLHVYLHVPLPDANLAVAAFARTWIS